MVYDDRHRTFVQALMQAGTMLEEDAVILCVKIFDEKIDISTISLCINAKLEPLAMLMKAGICELTGRKYWSIVGTTLEETVKIPSQFTESQKMFLRLIFSEIISREGCISSTNCLNLSNAIETKFSMGEADEFLKNLIQENYLYNKDGSIYMGVRSIIELMPYFRVTYQDNFHKCFLCKEVIFYGQNCENCDKIYHLYCLFKYSKGQNKCKCPECRHNLDFNYTPERNTVFQTLHQDSDDENIDTENDTE